MGEGFNWFVILPVNAQSGAEARLFFDYKSCCEYIELKVAKDRDWYSMHYVCRIGSVETCTMTVKWDRPKVSLDW